MTAQKRQLTIGIVLMVAFIAVLIVIFLPIFDGQNALNYMDSLFNSISKGSADYIGGLQEEAKELTGNAVSVTLTFGDEAEAREIEPLFSKNGVDAEVSGAALKITGDLGVVMNSCLADASHMFANNGAALSGKYGREEKRVMYNWWRGLKALDKALKQQKKFSESKFVTVVIKKGVECSYNYYGIESQKISERFLVVLISLVFYVLYTLWYGFAILYLFEGCGLKLSH